MAYKREKWRKLKQDKIALFGGKCALCGYDKCVDALVFHHKDPKTKESEKDWSKEGFKKENYILVCANCHAEIHQKQREEIFRNYKGTSIAEQTSGRRETVP